MIPAVTGTGAKTSAGVKSVIRNVISPLLIISTWPKNVFDRWLGINQFIRIR
jgi:hypothetical protein